MPNNLLIDMPCPSQVLLQHRTLRNYVSPDYVLPRLAEKLLFAAVIISLYFGKGSDLSTLNVPVLSSLLFLQAWMCTPCLCLAYTFAGSAACAC